MATAGIIHGNDGMKTDGSGGGVDFVKEGEQKRREERRGVEKIIRGDNFRCAMGVTESEEVCGQIHATWPQFRAKKVDRGRRATSTRQMFRNEPTAVLPR